MKSYSLFYYYTKKIKEINSKIEKIILILEKEKSENLFFEIITLNNLFKKLENTEKAFSIFKEKEKRKEKNELEKAKKEFFALGLNKRYDFEKENTKRKLARIKKIISIEKNKPEKEKAKKELEERIKALFNS